MLQPIGHVTEWWLVWSEHRSQNGWSMLAHTLPLVARTKHCINSQSYTLPWKVIERFLAVYFAFSTQLSPTRPQEASLWFHNTRFTRLQGCLLMGSSSPWEREGTWDYNAYCNSACGCQQIVESSEVITGTEAHLDEYPGAQWQHYHENQISTKNSSILSCHL
jgi:hypothetical protein